MKLKRNREITIKAWLDQTVLSNEDWNVYSHDEGDIMYLFAKDPSTGRELKIKIEKFFNKDSENTKENK